MTPQEIFDKVNNGLIAQGVFCTNDFDECRYRNASGHKCAVGMLITDKEYDECEMEGLPVYCLDISLITDWANVDLIRNLQCVHNDVAINGNGPKSWRKWRNNMRKTANEFNLIYTNV